MQTHFHYKQQQVLPDVKNISTEWQLASLFYKSDKDPKIEADLVATEKILHTFAKKWRKKAFATNVKLLKQALTEYEELSANPVLSRPARYFWLRSCIDTNDTKAEQMGALITRRLREAYDGILFFTLTIGAIPKKQQRELLKEAELKPFRYYLERLFLGSKHNLSEAEEKIINLKSPQSYGMWVDMTDKIISNRTIAWRGKVLHLPAAIEYINEAPFKDKQKIWDLITRELKQISEVTEHEFNAIVTDSHTEGEKRGYQKPYSATVLAYEDTEASLEALVSVVTKKGFPLSQKFYAAKAQLHDVPTLQYAERNAQIGDALNITFTEAVAICRDVFYGLKIEYGQLFDEMLARGQIDVFPKAGKQGGAFMSSQTGHPIMVMLNHTNTFNALETLAHEMGHAIHAKQSLKQSSFYDGYSTITAETASTLFENLVFDAVFAQANPLLQKTLLHDRLIRDISTIQRQIAFFNTELAIHNHIIEHGAITKEKLRDVSEQHLQAYLGKKVELTHNDGYTYVYVSHLRYGFYVYSYTFGLLMSSIMSERYKQDNNYIEAIDTFLSAGASATVADIFKSIDINTTKPETFEEALLAHGKNVHQFVKMVKQGI